jgi:7,8-dihydro-6-hydroxymethylpterin-pyrophosphokinase
LGRVRNGDKNQSRFIDIDILLFNDAIINEEHCHIPHPRMHLRQFVLQPMNDIAPNVVHPVFKKTMSQLLYECSDLSPIKRLNDVHLY